MRKNIDYNYTYRNKDNYNLCLFVPNIGGRLMVELFVHIGREYFRMLLPASVRTTDYYGAQGEQRSEQWEYMKYDDSGYLTEVSHPKNKADSLITVFQRKEYSTSSGFQVLPIVEQHYLGSSGKRQLLKSQETEYGLQEIAAGWKWNTVSKESLFDLEVKKLHG